MSSSPRPWKVVLGHRPGTTEQYRRIVDANGVDVFLVQYPERGEGSYVTAAGEDMNLIVDAVNTRALAAGETYPNSQLAQEGMIVAEELARHGETFGAETVKSLVLTLESLLWPHGNGLEHRRSDAIDAMRCALQGAFADRIASLSRQVRAEHDFDIRSSICIGCGASEREIVMNPRPCLQVRGPSPLQPAFEAMIEGQLAGLGNKRVEPAADVEERFNLPPGTLTKKHPRTP